MTAETFLLRTLRCLPTASMYNRNIDESDIFFHSTIICMYVHAIVAGLSMCMRIMIVNSSHIITENHPPRGFPSCPLPRS